MRDRRLVGTAAWAFLSLAFIGGPPIPGCATFGPTGGWHKRHSRKSPAYYDSDEVKALKKQMVPIPQSGD
jgi:hypothetical protein